MRLSTLGRLGALLALALLAAPAWAQVATPSNAAPNPGATLDTRTIPFDFPGVERRVRPSEPETMPTATFLGATAYTVGSRTEVASRTLADIINEGFTTVPPAGWSQIKTGDTSTSMDWVVSNTAASGNCTSANPCATSGFGGTAASARYIVTPQFTPTAVDNILTFRAAQAFPTVYNSVLTIRVATVASPAATDFTTIRTITEAQLPVGITALSQFSVDLSAYAGVPITLAFVHEQNNGDRLYLDDVRVSEPLPASFASTTLAFQNTAASFPGGEYYIVAANVVVNGTTGTVPITSVTFTTTGSTSAANIARARVIYTGAATTFNLATTPQFGTPIVSPSGTMTFTGSQALPPGNNYFLLVYQLTSTATVGNVIDGTYTSATVDGTARTPTLTTISGTSTITARPVNDNLASAKVVTPVPYTNSQTNAGATAEANEAAATCTSGGAVNDGMNSIWYAYTPAASGSITTTSNGFDTIHTVYTGSAFPLTQVGCADNFASGTAESVTVPVTAGTTYYIRVTGFGGASGTAAVTVSFTAAFTISPSTTQTLGTAGTCAGSTSLSTTFTVTNNGSTPFTVTGATLTGGTGFAVNTANLPATLATSQTVTIPVTFTPTTGQTGATSTQFAVAYDNGTPQTSAAITINATATAANLANGTGAGIGFRNSNATSCNAAATAPAPSGTGFIDITGHAQVTAWTGGSATAGDDSYFTLTPATLSGLVGNIRLYGRTYTSFNINSNALFGSAAVGSTPGTFPTTTFGDAVAAYAQDLNLAPTVYEVAGATADPGQYPVGAYYGLADGDGDGAVDDLVITWFHVYDFGSPVYSDPNARYITVQLVVIKAPRPNQDDIFEVRFPSGNDAAGSPYSRNVTTGGSTTLENDAEIAMTQSSSTTGASSEYREDTAGGPTFLAGGAANTVRFTPETQATAVGTAPGVRGYRMMGVPVTGYTVARLADLNLVQRVIGQYPTAPGPNLYTSYAGTIPAPSAPATNFVAATNVTNTLVPGQGFFWLVYDRDIPFATVPAANGAGTSSSYLLPMALQGTGAANTANVSRTLVPLSATNDGFSMLANPFRAGLDISGVGTWTGGATLASTVLQTWDPNASGGAGTYVLPMSLPTPNVFAPWQGFWVENNTSTSLTIPASASVSGGTFVGRPADSTATALAFRLDGTVATTGAPTIDLAAALVAPAELAADGWDVYDASKLAPLATTYATVGFQGTFLDGTARVKAQESRALDAASFDVPLVVDAVGTAPGLTLSWAGLDALPETWALELRDLVTGTTVDLRTAESYTFEQTATAARPDTDDLVAATTTAAQAKAGDAPRFVLHVTTGRTTAGEGAAVAEFALAAPAPNPTAGSTAISFDVPSASVVDVSVYDLLGRRVATLAQGETAAGRHAVRLDAGALAPGVYVVRMTATGGGSGTFSAVRRVTIVR